MELPGQLNRALAKDGNHMSSPRNLFIKFSNTILLRMCPTSCEEPKSDQLIKLDIVQLCETQKVRLLHVMVGLMGVGDGEVEVVNAMGQWIVDAMSFQKIYG